MSISCSLDLVCAPGFGASLFPQVERRLRRKTYSSALDALSKRKNRGKYRTTLDFLFCEIFTDHKEACFKFYKGGGPTLDGTLGPEELREYELFLILALQRAVRLVKSRPNASWVDLMKTLKGGVV